MAAKRERLAATMWASAGIVRRRADMLAGLQALAGLHHEAQVRVGTPTRKLMLVCICLPFTFLAGRAAGALRPAP